MLYRDPWSVLIPVAVITFTVTGPAPLRAQDSPPVGSAASPAAVQRVVDYADEVTILTAPVAGSVEARFKVVGMGGCYVEIRGFYGGTERDEHPSEGVLSPGSWGPWRRVADHSGATTIRVANHVICQHPDQVVLSQVRYWSALPDNLLRPREVPTGVTVTTEDRRVESTGVGEWSFLFVARPPDSRVAVIRVNRFLTEDLCRSGRADYLEVVQGMLLRGDAATREAVRFSIDTMTECTVR